MKTLTKVKLINWHSFTNESFEVYHNTLMTGENSAGKSTILDAIQYVLTVGTCKFNKAASDIGTRTLESYIRCKTGKEGQEYERNGDVSCYIALEFYDEKTRQYQVIGAAIDLMRGSKPIRDFFQIINTQIKDVTFILDDKVLTRKQFKDILIQNKQIAYFKDTIKEGKRLFANALSVKPKYFELVSRALAFKAIDNVYNFIMDFLLKEDYVDINNLRQSIQHYQQLEEQLKVSKVECDALAKIAKQYDDFATMEFKKEVLLFVREKMTEKHLLHLIEQDKNNEKNYNAKVNQLNYKLIQIDTQYESYRKQLDVLEDSMQQNESYQLRKNLNEKFKELDREKNKNENKYKDVIQKIKDEARLLKKINGQNKFIDYVNNSQYDGEVLNEHIQNVIHYIKERKNKLYKDIQDKKIHLKENIDEYNDILNKYNALKNNQFSYKNEIQELINLLKEKLFMHYGKHVEVKPLCEYLEVKDESWRNALEAYLNTQRFDIIIDPEYFEYALLVYEEYKNKRGIYGVGIVDVAKLKKYDDIEIDGTLANQLICKNTYAKWYVNMLLRYVKCVDDARDLRKHRTAITRTVMLYKNYTVRALNPRSYKVPFIGYNAIKIQMKQLEVQLTNLKEIIDKEKKDVDQQQKILDLINQSQAESISFQIDIIDEYQSIEKQLHDIKTRLDNLKLDDSIFALQEEYDKLSEQFSYIRTQKRETTEEVGKIKDQLKSIKHQLEQNQKNQQTIHESIVQYEMDHIDITQQTDQWVRDYEKRYFRDFQSIFKSIDQCESQYDKDLSTSKNNIVFMMNNYNNEFNIGFENSLDDIQSYLKRYFQLRDMDIIDKTEKTRQAKLKCKESFKTSFISGLNEKIENAKRNINALNKGLSQRNFNGETYEFIVTATKKENFKEYYKIIQTGKEYMTDNLLSETLNDGQRRIMDELFAKLSSVENDKETDKTLMEYTDYRNYLDYDIKINYDDGSFAYFSKVNKEKSGGETQTPFYVIMAASFEQVIQNQRQNEDFGCVVLLDEAFNNMDERRIQEMIKFYNERDIQTFIIVPPSRAATIIPYVNTRLLVIKQDNHSFVEVITDEK